MNRKKVCRPFLMCTYLMLSSSVYADGLSIDKIYHPYVEPLEKEFEWRGIATEADEGTGSFQKHRFAYGQSINDVWFAELYLIAEKVSGHHYDLEAYEIEVKRQLTEQGEYGADFAVMFELEKVKEDDIWEFSTGFIVEKEWGKWSGTSNLFVISEWGDDIEDELETELNLQARYRHSRALEPAIELYLGEDTQGLGPVLLGQVNLGMQKKMKWEAGVIFGLDDDTPDSTFRFMLEYEFY